MATSYTSLLGLALPVTGELAGTWGDTVNNSITSLLDTAVAGTTTLSTDADVTLTTTTGASNQARQAILLCSGARTALRTITAPAQSKIYVVINSTTGGFGVKLVGAGPTTGVTVAAGKTAVLVWNGSDFVEVAPATATTATNLAGGLAGSVPYQTAANTTTMLAIGAANYVLTSTGTAPTWTANTGTGSVVRATSPTIATPTITTSATVPLLIGGTGTTSTLTLRSTSGVGTTGADIIFQTGNNGATEAMRILNSGNVGVGTASPAARLDVAGGDLQLKTNATYLRSVTTGGTSIRMLGINSSDIAYIGPIDAGPASVLHSVASSVTLQSFFTGGSERMRIDSAGNVGIGTNAPTAKLHVDVDGNGALFTRNGVAAVIPRTNIDNSDGSFILGQKSRGSGASPTIVNGGDRTLELWGRGYDGATYQSAGRITIDVDGTPGLGDMPGRIAFYTTADGASTTTERMRIDSAGNVGIGTAPTAKLHVYGGGAYTLYRQETTSATTEAAWQNTLGNTVIGTDGAAGYGYIGTFANQHLRLYTNSIERMRIDSSGNVGMGVTPAAWGAGWTAVQVRQSAIWADNTTKTFLTNNTYYDGTNRRYVISGVAQELAMDAAGAYIFKQASSGTAGAVIPFTSSMTLDASGVLMVNATTPIGNTRVHIAQNSDANYSTSFTPGTTKAQLVLRDLSDTGTYTTPFSALTFVAGSSGAGSSYIAGAREGSGTSFMAFGTGTASNATERMRIDSSGRLLIGQTASRGTVVAKLQVDDSRISITSGSNGIIGGLAPDSSVSNSLNIEADPDNVAASSRIVMSVDGTERMRIDSTGRLLVTGGTTTGMTKQLNVYTAAEATVLLAADSTGEMGVSFRDQTAGTNWGGIQAFNNSGANRYIVFNNGGEKMRLDVNGKLLLGTTTRGLGGNADMTVANGTNTVYSSVTGSTVQAYVGVDASTGFIGNYTNHPLLFLTNNTERVRVDTAGNLGVGNAAPLNKLDVNGSLGRNAPVTKTGSFTLAATENWLICNGAGTITVTLPAASSWTGREVMIKTIAAQTVVSASSNVVPLAGGAAGTAILAATAGKFATLVSDGTNWIIMQAN